MATANRSMAQLWIKRQAEYKVFIAELQEKEKTILASLENLSLQNAAIKKMELSFISMDLISYFILLGDLCKTFTKVKSDLYLNEARKSVYKALIYLEDVVSPFIDVPFSEYEEKLKLIANFPDLERMKLTNRLGLCIDMVIEALGENSKWKWSYTEMRGRFTIILKNFIDLRKYVAEMDPRSVGYEERIFMMEKVKRMLNEVADAYRQKYELTTQRVDDIKVALQFLGALKRLHGYLGENEEAEDIKKKYEVWKTKMEADSRKSEQKDKKSQGNTGAASPPPKKGFFSF